MKTYYGKDFSFIGTCVGAIIGSQFSTAYAVALFELLHKRHSAIFIFTLTLPFTISTMLTYSELCNLIGLELEIY